MSDFSSDYKDLLSTFNLVNSPNAVHKNDYRVSDSKPSDASTVTNDSNLVVGDGIIFTDINILSKKFSTTKEDIKSVIDYFISSAAARGFDWVLLDASGPEWNKYVSSDKSPIAYHKVLDAFTAELSWNTTADTCLLIIGGMDVIPVKQSIDPYRKQDYLTDEDIFYCYPLNFNIKDEVPRFISESTTPEQVSLFLINKAIFNVSRLPIDAQKINIDFDTLIGNYFDRVDESNGFIPVNNITFATAKQWKYEAGAIAEDLPLINIADKTGTVENGIFYSPIVDLDNNDTLSEFKEALSNSELLLFNLHGASDYNISSYFGDNGNPFKHTMPRAFDIESLAYSKGHIINTMACFGAKYYNVGHTILLSSLYSKVLLFAGSSNISWGRRSADAYCGCAETLLKLYTHILLNGIPAGKAFLMAKCDYLAFYMTVDTFDKALFTIREFNLFGDPSLSCQCDYESKSKSHHNYTFPFIDKFKGAIHNAYGITALSVLDEAYETVRDAVDNNLREISIRLEHYLFNDLGYNDVKLSKIEKINTNNYEKGYRFTYSFEQPFYRGCVEVITDTEGKNESVFYTK